MSAFRVAAFFGGIAVLFVFVSGVSQSVGALFGLAGDSLLSLLFVGTDDSVPSWYSAVLLLVCGAISAFISRECFSSRGRWRWHWAGLAGVFFYLSTDEAISIHEKFSPLGASMLAALGAGGGVIERAWVVPGIIAVFVFSLVYASFFLSRDRDVRTPMLLAAVVFVSGAVGVEVLTDFYVAANGGMQNISVWQNVVRTIFLPHLEEFMEMLGVVVMIYALLLQVGKTSRSYTFEPGR